MQTWTVFWDFYASSDQRTSKAPQDLNKKMLGLGGAHENKGREVKKLFAGNQARPLLIMLYFPGHQCKEPLKKSRSWSQSPVPSRSVLFVRKWL